MKYLIVNCYGELSFEGKQFDTEKAAQRLINREFDGEMRDTYYVVTSDEVTRAEKINGGK